VTHVAEVSIRAVDASALPHPRVESLERARLDWPRLRLLRPRQWIKNTFVLAPLIFSGSLVRRTAVVDALLATFLFCVAASATYVFNDLRDRDADRLHPVKRHSRPIASGAVSVAQAHVILASLAMVLLGALLIDRAVTAVIVGYLLLNIAYTLKLKRVPVIDLFTLAAGFVLRVFAGAVAISLVVSPWMLITTLCLSLYLAAIKRRDELAGPGAMGREVLRLYTPALLDRFAERAALGAMVFYGLFVITVRPALAATIPLVLFGMFRYSFVVDRTGAGESPTDALWRDKPLALTVVAWAALCAYTLWPH
jgi:decaprenyl-phosphate phosphoribosyltransferase